MFDWVRKKRHKKNILKLIIGTSSISAAFLVFTTPSLIHINNLGTLAKAMNQNRAYRTSFDHTRINARRNSIISPFLSDFKSLTWKALLGVEYLYGTRWPTFIKSEVNPNDERSAIYLKSGSSWDYTWSNSPVYGPVVPSNRGPYTGNFFELKQYDGKKGDKLVNYKPNYVYSGELAHNTLFAKTASYVMNIPNNVAYYPSDPIVIQMSKAVLYPSGAYNQTNSNYISIEYGQNWWWTQSDNKTKLGYILYENGDVQYKHKGRSIAHISFILARENGRTGRLNLYALDGNTTTKIHSLESSIMPNTNDRGNYLATEWAKDLMNSNKKLVDYSATNAIPSTFYSTVGDIVANNLEGTITFTIKPGVMFEKDHFASHIREFLLSDYCFTYNGKASPTTTFTYSGFKKVKPTQLKNEVDVKNPYIQPQYVTIEEIKKIVWTQCIIGSLPDGFSTNNVVLTDVKRFNTTGTIRATVYLTLYFDGNGDIKTNNFSPVEIFIKGFAQTNFSVLPANITVQNYRNILPTDVSVELIQEIIYQEIVNNNLIWIPGVPNKNACFPQNFSKDDLIIRNGVVFPDNLSGSIRVDIATKNFFDDNGEIVSTESNLGRVTIRNFNRVQPTVIANNAYDYIDPSGTLYPTDVASNVTLLKNFMSLQLPDFMKPANFEPNRDVQLSNIIANNKDGTIYATVWLNNYYDSRGVIRQTGFVPKDVIFNFQNSISETNLPTEINVSNSHGEIKANEINEEDIKKIIYDNILLGKPKDFSTNNIKFDVLPQWESQTGRIIVEPILNYWVDGNGNFRTDQRKFPQITIYGFLGSPVTRFNEKVLLSAGVPSWIPTSVAQNIELLKEIISRGIQGKPKDFSNNNIQVISTKPNNIVGELEAVVSLNYFNDNKGNPQTSGFEPATITIGGFGISEMPTTINTYIAGEETKLTQYYSENDIKELIIENINFPVDGMNKTNISLKNINYDYINGRITFVPILNLWYGHDLMVHTEPKDFPETTIGNLKTVQPTIIAKDALEIGDPNIEASEFAKDYTKNLLPFVERLIVNPPATWNLPTSLELRDIYTNDKEGTIELEVILHNYYDATGLLRSDGFVPERIKIGGFKKITGPTSIENVIELQGYEDVYPFEITKSQIKQLIFDNLTNKTPGMTIHNISLYNTLDIDNFLGTVKIIPLINTYYDDNGQVVFKNLKLNEVTFKNFKTSLGVTTLKRNTWNGDANILPSEVIKDFNSLKKQVNDNLEFTPPNFDYQSDIEIENLFHDNITGTVSFDINLKQIYDRKGTIVSGQFYFGNIIINGYMSSPGYTSVPNRIQTTKPTLYASDMNEMEIKNLVFSNIKNPPHQLTIDQMSIKKDSIIIDNKLGTIKLVPILNWTYNVYGELINIPKEFNQITIYGFKNSFQTIFTATTASAKKYANISNLYPNELASNLDLLKNVVSQLIDKNTIPTGFGNDNIEIDNIQPNNYTGSITFDVKLNKYFDQNGVIQDNNFIPINMIIIDMQKSSGPTSILKIINSTNKNITPERVSNDEIKQLIINNTFNLPSPFQLNDIEFKIEPNRNNLNGSINVIPIFKKSYNSNNDLVSVPIEFNEITINGYLSVSPTNLLNDQINYNGNELPFELAADKNKLKQIVMENLSVSRPQNFSINNIIIKDENIIYDNILGKITFAFSLDNYYNEKGLLETKESEIKWMTIDKLHSISTTTPYESQLILPNVQTELPSTFEDQKIIDYLKINFNSLFNYLPKGFDVNNDLLVDVRDKNNINGTITALIKLKKYYNHSGQLFVANDINDYATFTMTFRGFYNIQPTTIDSEIYLSNQETISAQSVAYDNNKLLSVITQNIDTIFENKPENFDIADIVLDKNAIKSYNNQEGSITLEISIRNYYDINGNHINKTTDSKKYLSKVTTLKGFMRNIGTSIIPIYDVSNYSNRLPSKIDNNDLSRIIIDNARDIFSSLPSWDNIVNNFEIEKLTYNNRKGEVEIKLSLYEYFDSKGNKVVKSDNIPLIQNIVLRGFKRISPTTISNELLIKDQANNLATNINEEQLKILLYSNLNNLLLNIPDDFSITNDLEMNILEANNITGSLLVNVSLKYYIDDFGFIIRAKDETDTLNKTILIKGFKKVNQTEIFDEVHVNGYNTTNPYSITNEQLRSIIYNNLNMFFINLPQNFNQDHLFINIVSVDRTTGSIYVNINITTYYDTNEILIIDGSYLKTVKITGFRSINSPGSSTTTLIAVTITSIVLTIAFAAGVLFSIKLSRKRLKL